MRMNLKKNYYYVSCTDRFMSGWGLAKDKINKLVFVYNYLKRREEMLYVSKCQYIPYYDSSRYYTQFKNYHNWPDAYKVVR